MAGDPHFLARSLLDIVEEISKIGEYRNLVRKECVNLTRRVTLLSPLFEEIRDFKAPVSDKCRLCLDGLVKVLRASKGLLQIGHCASQVFLVFEGKWIASQFQDVSLQLEKTLGSFPYESFEISDEIREQVELVHAQLKRSKERNGSMDLELLSDVTTILSHQAHVKDLDNSLLRRVMEKLEIVIIDDVNQELQALHDSPIHVPSQSLEQMKNVLGKLKDCILSCISNIEGAGVNKRRLSNRNNSFKDDKTPDSLIIPDDFRCPISLELMRDPVIVATGQTYERSCIQRWIDGGHKTCPKTQQTLPHLTLTPNYVLRSLITQWCDAHGVEQPKRSGSTRLRKSSDGTLQEVGGNRALIDSLVTKLSSGVLDDQRSAAGEIRLLAKRSTDNRICIGEAGAIPILVRLLSTSDPRTQEHVVTALLNLSIFDNNKSIIVLAGAIPHIVEVIRVGSMEARENAAAALFSLSLVDENKITIGAAGAIPALVGLLCSGSPRGKKDAATALFNLCIYQGNKARAVRAGILNPLMTMLTDTGNGMVDEALTILAVIASHPEGKVAIAKANAIPVLVDLTRTGLPRNKENAVAILLTLCKKDGENLACVKRLGAYIPLTELVKSGTERAKRKAASLLEHMGRLHQL